ncbi:MAG: hypothetical protein WC928_00930 [Patescibacteria group bacterium]|jgi:4-amino-4-deoxy-L-arabinose transferase-like glycosyltransferase
MKKIEKFFREFNNKLTGKLHLVLVLFFCLVFFFLASILPYQQEKNDFIKFLSPDENANYIFAKLYQKNNSLSFFEKYNLLAEDVIKPRSYFSHNGELKPVSFLGIIIIYGGLAKVFGTGIIPFLTPFFATVGLFFYYLLMKLFFGPKNGLVSFFLLFSLPVLFYYSTRSMFHNVLFLTFFIIGLYFFSYLIQKKPIKYQAVSKKDYYKKIFSFDFIYASLAGIFMGLTIAVRSSELVWLLPAGLLFLILKWKNIKFFRLSIFFSFIVLTLLPIFYNNQILYNSPFYGGYYEMNKSLEDISQASGGILKSIFSGHLGDIKDFSETIFNTVFYFGFNPIQSLKMFFRYGVQMFWYLFWPALLGFIYLLAFGRKILFKIWPYILSWVLLSLILVFYYGSWRFVDNPDPKSFTIGNSYTRYWLPIYIGLIPLASFFILNLAKIFFFLRNKKALQIINIVIPIMAVVLFSFLSFKFVYSGSEEGLNRYSTNLQNAKAEVERVLLLTENNSVIITEYHDKFLFPERKVIVGRFNDDNMVRNYYNLSRYLPIYYYNFTFPEKDFNYLNNRRLINFDLGIELVENVNDTFSLYKLYSLD